MYEPLKFLEQMDNFIYLTNGAEGVAREVNQRNIDWVEKKGKPFIIKEYFHVQQILSSSILNPNILVQKYKDLVIDWSNYVQVAPLNIEDFFNMLAFMQIRNEWGKSKIAYKVDKHLLKTLSSMELPKEVAIDCVSKTPVNCFYVDFDGSNFCENCCGCFANFEVIDDTQYILFVLLVKDKKSGRVMPIRTHFCVNIAKDNETDFVKCSMNIERLKDNLKLVLENDLPAVFNEKLFCNFIFNFIIYLNASNRDVEVSEVTKSVYRERKPSEKPKNSFKEVKQYEVGFRYGKSIKAGNKRVKYEKSNSTNIGSSRTVSSHYRSAHWHTYWVGSGENKGRIIKWVEGVFVNGDESKNVVIRKVK